jgi:amino acid permease
MVASVAVSIIIVVKSIQMHSAQATHEVFTKPGDFVRSFNTIIFSFGFHSVIPNIEQSMARRR